MEDRDVGLESYIQRSYAETRAYVEGHPFGADSSSGVTEDPDNSDEPAAAPPTDQRGRDLRAS